MLKLVKLSVQINFFFILRPCQTLVVYKCAIDIQLFTIEYSAKQIMAVVFVYL